MLMRANGQPVAAETTTLSHNPSFCHDFLAGVSSSSIASSTNGDDHVGVMTGAV